MVEQYRLLWSSSTAFMHSLIDYIGPGGGQKYMFNSYNRELKHRPLPFQANTLSIG